jgi:PAS domain S-box-containing protein
MDGTLVDVNPAYANIIGRNVEETLKLTYWDITPEKYAELEAAQLESLETTERYGPYEKEYIHKDGHLVPVRLSGMILEKDGEPFILSSVEDITERKRAVEELRLERDNLIKIFEAMEDGVYIVNQQYDIQYVNTALKKDFGPHEDRKCYEYFHDRKEVCPWCKNQDVFAGKTVRWEWFSFKNQKTYDLIDTPVRNPDGTISKLEIFRDITDRKKAEEELEKHREHLEEMVKERTAELQTIVNAMAGREVRMAELKETIRKLRAQLEEEGLTPVADDPLKERSD